MPLGLPLLKALDGMGYGGVVLDAAGRFLRINETAARLLSKDQNLDRSKIDLADTRRALEHLLHLAGINDRTVNEDNWTPVPLARSEARHPLIVRIIPIESAAPSDPHKVMILIDLEVAPRPKVEVLKRVFGLTATEARLAIELTGGKSPEDVAVAAGVSIATVRKQLATVFSKTNTHRQSELVALLTRLAILP